MQVLQVQLEVGADPAEVGRARRWARSRLIGSGMNDDEPLAETLILLISELVTNAVVHTGCPAVLRMLFGSGAVEAGTVRVEVADTSARPPHPRHAQGGDTNGRGLELVDGLADRWGWQPEGSGKRIWCEVDRCEPDGSAEYEPSAAVRAQGRNDGIGRYAVELPVTTGRPVDVDRPADGSSKAVTQA
ncbi:ATP-binding protein [Streptomyces sp. NBC_01716]|uniref:ATP-binding protein n=1 Tax=Streptomyces sp. NBC_01716 TaxID=2975917 RepID=UPI002E31547B|nr:ATP-binding protein [Streptomyces sp. NBC_01716]